MKRSAELGKPGNNLPSARGKQKNKHRFDELKLQRLQAKQIKMETEFNKEINNENSL